MVVRGFSAADVFSAQYRLAELKAVVTDLFTRMDVLILPTVGTTFSVTEVVADLITTNPTLGHYTTSAICSTCVRSPYLPGSPATEGRRASWRSARRCPTIWCLPSPTGSPLGAPSRAEAPRTPARISHDPVALGDPCLNRSPMMIKHPLSQLGLAHSLCRPAESPC